LSYPFHEGIVITVNLHLEKGEVRMAGSDAKGSHVGRRDFIKTTTLASVAVTLPGTALVGQDDVKGAFKPSPEGIKRNVLFLTDSPKKYEPLINKIKAIKEFEFTVSPVELNLQKSPDIASSIRGKNADILIMTLPQVTTSSGNIAASAGDLDVPVILFPVNLDLIMLEADVAAKFRARGINAMLANSEAHALELIKIAATPRILEGKRAVIFGRPFDSTSIPALNLTEDYVYKHTGVRLQYRPIEELKQRLESIDEATAVKEMERWKKEAIEVVETTDKAILDSSRLYFLLRSIIEKEGLSGLSIDCLSFSFNSNPILPYPCLPFTRLRDEGFAVPCEADVCGMLSSMVLQEISRKPSYFCNVSAVDTQKSTAVLRHCVSPLKLMGSNTPALPYRLRDYHGMGRGVTAEVQFPAGIDITMGGFSKDLKEFLLWPGKTVSRIRDTDRPSFENAPPSYAKMRRYCSNHLEAKIRDVDSFIQKIAGCHHVMVAGNYNKAVGDAMVRMNVRVVGPSDLSALGT
jgi:L-fucose isomerase-like protein